MVGILQTIRQLLGYSLLAILLFSNPVGWYFIYLLFSINKDTVAYDLWLAIDRIFCRICHGTHRRTISGWTGQWQHLNKRYHHQAKVIDWLALKIANDKNHCHQAYLWELKQGWV